MPKYFDGLGNDITHWVETLLEKEKAVEGLEQENLKLKGEIRRLKIEVKKKKETE